ncbi:unnamed protein product, partial [Mesorhabditis belari]|uniref:C-type lectin domain-containing protein n=1 Tax=Mesorhabditis belari TaxID=2138241 RepID=A0AAF3F6F1_9BILA
MKLGEITHCPSVNSKETMMARDCEIDPTSLSNPLLALIRVDVLFEYFSNLTSDSENGMGVMAFGLFITILLLFHQISSSIQQGDQADQFTNETQQELVEARGKISELETEIARKRNETKDKDVEMSRLTAKMAQIEANLIGKNAKFDADLVDGRESNRDLERKVAEMKRKNDDLEAQLNRTINLLDLYRDRWSYLAKTAYWYKAFKKEMTFDEAEAYCVSRKSHLVSIHSQEEHDFVFRLENVDLDDGWSFWIGLKRNSKKGNAFEWTDGSSVNFTNWDERSGHSGSDTHAWLGSHDGKWGVYPPTYQILFICKTSSQF